MTTQAICGFLIFTLLLFFNPAETASFSSQNNVVQMKMESQSLVPVKKVHIVFMNHLDVGYYDGRDNDTGLAVQVLNRYLTEYFERAINLSQALTDGGYTETFIYTTQPWLVSLYLDCPNVTLAYKSLKCPSVAQVARFKSAVSAGVIAWHAGPMNLQTDNMAGALFQYGLDLSKSLDTMFGINRTHPVYSQRDVPGLTKGVIGHLVGSGVKAISVGVNPGTAPPALPSPCLWKYSEKDKDGVMFFQVKGGYPLNPGPNPAHPRGLAKDKCHMMPGLNEVLCFAFRTDNTGPPMDVEEVLGYYEILRAEFPGAELVASTLDNFVAKAEPLKSQLPVYTSEMGDTWIQGVASDPKKTAMYRALSRSWISCIEQGQCKSSGDERLERMKRWLIKLPEHTWGAHYFLDNKNWTNEALAKARAGDIYKRTELAWVEQRQFLDFAMEALADHPLKGWVEKEFAAQEANSPDLTGYEETSIDQEFTCVTDGTVLKIEEDGSLSRLYDPYNKMEWASLTQRLGQVTYDTYIEQDFFTMAKLYNYEAGVGYNKANCTKYAHPEKKRWDIRVAHIYRKKSDPGCDLWVQLATTDKDPTTKYGAPKNFFINYALNRDNPGIDLTLLLLDKVVTRLPESISVNFSPMHQDQSHSWFLDKMDVPVDPCHVVLNGSQYVHGVTSGVSFTNKSAQGLFFSTHDVPLVLIGTKDHMTSPFPVPLQPIKCSDITSFAFNVFNNIWNTNFIYYYPWKAEDANLKSRFSILFT